MKTFIIKMIIKNITVWVVFIIFVLGPCEALLPILTAASVVSMSAVISSTTIFSVATITIMLLAVSLGYLSIEVLRFKKLEAPIPMNLPERQL